MKTPRLFAQKEKGQVIVLLAIMAVTILALIFLVVDGGLMMISRRQAQAAADAGALAGAKALCEKKSSGEIQGKAELFVSNNNGVPSGFSIDGNLVSITASVLNNSIFFKDPAYTNASATAGCFIPSKAKQILPIAWTCDHLVGTKPNMQCVINYNETVVFIDAGNGASQADTPETTCIGMSTKDTPPLPGTMVCDLDGDGTNEVFGGGNRSWLGLEFKVPGNSSLVTWLTPPNFYPGEVSISPPLYPAKPGTNINVYRQLHSLVPWPDPFILPVIDSVSTDGKLWSIGGFSTFYLTCVNLNTKLPNKYNPKTWKGGSAYNDCPGGAAWLEANKERTASYTGYTLEGYFVRDYPENPTGGSGGLDAGVFYISLTH